MPFSPYSTQFDVGENELSIQNQSGASLSYSAETSEVFCSSWADIGSKFHFDAALLRAEE